MIHDGVQEWTERVFESVARHNIIFIQLGVAFQDVRESLLDRTPNVVSAEEYIGSERQYSGTIVIDELEAISYGPGREIGPLRAKIFADVGSGSKFILLSTRPKIAFPEALGSSLISEARTKFPPDCEGHGFRENFAKNGGSLQAIVRESLWELGDAMCSRLDALLFDEEFELTSLDPPEHEALLSSGFGVVNDGSVAFHSNISTEVMRKALEGAIAGISGCHADFPETARNCWTIERQLKQSLRARAITLWTDRWKTELLAGNAFGKDALSRSTGTSFAGMDTIEDVRDPLEWLTVQETLRVREASGVGSLGLPSTHWTKFESEFLPIKDRIERSQLLRKTDRDVSSRWRKKFAATLSTSGSESPDATIASAPTTQSLLLRELHTELKANPLFTGDVERDFFSLVVSTVRYVAHVTDVSADFLKPFSSRGDAPKEEALQDHYRLFLDASQLSGLVANEVGTVGSGRADVVLHCNNGTRYVTEVKREFSAPNRESLEKKYISQAVSYQRSNIPLGHLLVLDLSRRENLEEERIDRSMWISHRFDDFGAVTSSVLVTVVRGNRGTPSSR